MSKLSIFIVLLCFQLVVPNAHSSSLKATGNIMGYNGALRKTTWYWQWELLWEGLQDDRIDEL